MYCFYDLKPLADQLHEEMLHEAHEHHLAKLTRRDGQSPPGMRRLGFTWRDTLIPLLRGVRTAARPS
jgi:hypothetical protein